MMPMPHATRPAVASDARRRAEEALAKTALLGPIAPASSTWVSVRSDDLAALLAERPGHDRIGELEALLRECNAVCLCGCPDEEHESYGEDGESCGHDDHECIRVAPAVLAYVNKLRSALLAEQEGGGVANEKLPAVVDRFGECLMCGHVNGVVITKAAAEAARRYTRAVWAHEHCGCVHHECAHLIAKRVAAYEVANAVVAVKGVKRG